MSKEKVTVADLAGTLINLQEKIKELQARMKYLKMKIKPYVRINPIETEDGSVRFVGGSASDYIVKDKLKQTLIQQLHLSEATAEKVMQMGSAKKIINSYVKVTVK